MNQERIWDYYQNEGAANGWFTEARPRFMLRYLKPGQAVLNVGVGDGSLERLALEKGIAIHALDPGERAIERLRESCALGDRARTGVAQSMPFDSGLFDAVVMSEVLEHLDDDTVNAALREAQRVLAPGGLLLISTPHAEDLVRNQVICPRCGECFHRWGHVQSFDKARLCGVVCSHGFSLVRAYVTTFVDWQRRGVVDLLKSLARLVLARLSVLLKERMADPHVIVVARKPLQGT